MNDRIRKQLPLDIAFNSGKLPPSAIDLEEAVLGACLIDKDGITEVIDIITPESFYKEEHQRIFSVIVNLFHKSRPIDILTVTESLKTNGDLDFIGGPFYISQITSRIASCAHAEYHARIIQQKFIAREMIRISLETIHDSFDETTDIFELLDKSESNLFAIANFTGNKMATGYNSLMASAISDIERINNRKGELTGVPSGFTAIDRITNGWQAPDLIIIAARPGMGKTAMVLSFAKNAAIFKRPTAIFSLEMSESQLMRRLISIETGIPLSKLNKGGLDNADWDLINLKIRPDLPLFIDDGGTLSILDFRRKARKLKAEKKVEMIIVDYLQLMTVSGKRDNKNREQEVSEIARGLKSVAKELNIPIIALSQLSRNVESRAGKKPALADLKESGDIEAAADIVCFIFRPGYYDKENSDLMGWGFFMIEKHRNGALAEIKVKWEDYLTKFSDWNDWQPNPTDYSEPKPF